MTTDIGVRNRMQELLPKLDPSEQAFVDNLPPEYLLPNGPYAIQEKKHWSGAACAQMILSFHGMAAVAQAAGP